MSQHTEISTFKRENRKSLRALIWSNYSYGGNITEQTLFKNIILIGFNISLLLTLVFGFYGQYNFIFRNFHTNLHESLESFCTTLQEMIAPSKMIVFMLMQSKFAEIFRTIEGYEIIEKIGIFYEDYTFKKELRSKVDTVLRKSWLSVHRMTKFFMFTCFIMFLFFVLNAIIPNTYNTIVGTSNFTVLMPFPAIFPFWEEKGMQFPYYQTEFFIILMAVYVTAAGAAGFDGLFIACTQHGVSCMKILRVLLEYSTHPDMTKEQRVKYMRYCIQHYNRSYKFCADINQLYRTVGFVQILLSMLALGIVMFIANLGLEGNTKAMIRMIMFFANGSFQVLIYCYYGQTVTSESEKTPLAFYNCEWYNESKEFRDLVKMMILRTNRTFYMEGSGFTFLLLTTFMALLRQSVSYFLLLKNVA